MLKELHFLRSTIFSMNFTLSAHSDYQILGILQVCDIGFILIRNQDNISKKNRRQRKAMQNRFRL